MWPLTAWIFCAAVRSITLTHSRMLDSKYPIPTPRALAGAGHHLSRQLTSPPACRKGNLANLKSWRAPQSQPPFASDRPTFGG